MRCWHSPACPGRIANDRRLHACPSTRMRNPKAKTPDQAAPDLTSICRYRLTVTSDRRFREICLDFASAIRSISNSPSSREGGAACPGFASPV